MAIKQIKPNKRSQQCDIDIIFLNKPSPKTWMGYRESVISANLQAHVPTYLQKPLLDKFVEAGLMSS